MSKPIYTAEAHVDGGRVDGHGKTSDGALEVDLRAPGAEGSENATNPEQLFAIGYASCFDNAVAAVARRQKVETGQLSIDSKVHLLTTSERGFKLAVELDVSLPSLEGDEAVELVRVAHSVCPYSNATKGNIEVKLTANGQQVS